MLNAIARPLDLNVQKPVACADYNIQQRKIGAG